MVMLVYPKNSNTKLFCNSKQALCIACSNTKRDQMYWGYAGKHLANHLEADRLIHFRKQNMSVVLHFICRIRYNDINIIINTYIHIYIYSYTYVWTIIYHIIPYHIVLYHIVSYQPMSITHIIISSFMHATFNTLCVYITGVSCA